MFPAAAGEGERAKGEAPIPIPRWEKSAARREAERLCRLAMSMSTSRWLPPPGERKDACAEEENPVGRLESPKSFRGEGDGEGAEWSSPTPRMGEPSLVKDPGGIEAQVTYGTSCPSPSPSSGWE